MLPVPGRAGPAARFDHPTSDLGRQWYNVVKLRILNEVEYLNDFEYLYGVYKKGMN